MPLLIAVRELSFRTSDGRTLFENLSLAFGRERTGLVGPNGVGKTSLLRLIAGELQPSSGSVTRQGRVGVLRQTLAPDPGLSVADMLGLAEPLARLDRIAAGRGDEADVSDADWMLEERLATAFARLGLAGLDPRRPAREASGGQLTRAALAGLIAAEPDVLLLDEPTNNMDAQGRRIVAEVVSGWRGGAVVVSHDRALLRRMDRIVELGARGAAIYGGGYDLYIGLKADAEAAARRELQSAALELERTQRELQATRDRKARRDSAGHRARARRDAPKTLLDFRAERAEYSGGRLSRTAERRREQAAAALAEAQGRIERRELLAVKAPESGLPAGRTLLALEEVGFAWPGQPPLFAKLDLRITGPERIAISGPNGSGKSTLLKLISGDIGPTSGRVLRRARAVHLDQGAALLRAEDSLLDNFRRLNPATTDNAAHAALARFLFRAGAALRSAGELSGGERLRAALACTLSAAEPPELLILDEPTNHLDLESIHAIEEALSGYEGALVVVSHDEDFLTAIRIGRRVALDRGV